MIIFSVPFAYTDTRTLYLKYFNVGEVEERSLFKKDVLQGCKEKQEDLQRLFK